MQSRSALPLGRGLQRGRWNSSIDSCQPGAENFYRDTELALGVTEEDLKEELSELRGERRVPPVVLSVPMVMCALAKGVLHEGNVGGSSCEVQMPNHTIEELKRCQEEMALDINLPNFDEDLAAVWAAEVKKGMLDAETLRSKDPTRPMAYKLVPEPWSRLRPTTIANHPTSVDSNQNNSAESPNINWSFATTRKPILPLDQDLQLIFRRLHLFDALHISCGAKFGCDFLLYDGPRNQRHAFAGLRIVTIGGTGTTTVTARSQGTEFLLPVPSPYDLAGYVRGLNTAGKLALLGTVVEVEGEKKIAIVDLALEKILTAPTHQRSYKKHKFQERKQVGIHLAKSTGST